MLARMQFTGTWRDYQARVLEQIDAHFEDGRLHVVAAPGSGKTVLGLEIVRQIGKPALILAPTIAIRDQWGGRLCPLFLNDPPGRDEVSRTLETPAKLTLSTYQALNSLERHGMLDQLLAKLNKMGPITLVLDEAHHLRREWWQTLERLVGGLEGARIVALTATPPYDASLSEWQRYEALCGPIDLEIGIPELVRNGDLCPHQDHVLFSQPTDDARTLLVRRRQVIGEIMHDLRHDADLLEALASHPWMKEPLEHVEAILDAPEMLTAMLVLLHGAGRPLPRAPLNLLGVGRSVVPLPAPYWLETFLDGLLHRFPKLIPMDQQQREMLRNRLHRAGLIEGGHVRLGETKNIFRQMSSSLSKLDSIVQISAAEAASLGPRLRMVILSDHVRAGELPASPTSVFKPARLGVIPIFEKLRRTGVEQDKLGVLTGTLVLIPEEAVHALRAIAAGHGVASGALSTKPMAACPGYVSVEMAGNQITGLVRLITELFSQGGIHILVGTQALLGEGWDAPCINSLVLASNTASYMLSNQMRGRAIRIDPAHPEKVANIWHLATVERMPTGPLEAMVDQVNWGGIAEGDYATADLEQLRRRFRAFEGIANGHSTLIENGLGRLGFLGLQNMDEANSLALAAAANRSQIARRWSVSLGDAEQRAHVHEIAAPDYAPRQLSWIATLHALGWSAAASGVFAAAFELRHLSSLGGAGAFGMVAAGAAVLATLPKLFKAARLSWRNGSLEGSLQQVALVVFESLNHAGVVSDQEIAAGQFEVRTSLDGRRDILLRGVSRSTERAVMLAIAEVLGCVQNPRYLLVRRSRLGPRQRCDFHAVPTVIGTNKNAATYFAAQWRNLIGPSELIYTRNAEGRVMLLRARARSFSAGFQRTVDQRSAWL